ncbi:hypothetical protein EFI48_17645 [Aeromonas veronii]|uniref:Uncharacterized protein n=1 Tax=Aeromonas veronii TaxID=654 RepID=A0AAN1QHE9_AERVE|nr:hypothetical protein [Aeromonas veronii]AYV38489.1 hypothetical protein EFI48_17645 [Aeromonas veronii]
MSARTKALLKRVGAVEKAVSSRYGGDSIEECGRYFRALDGLRKQDYLIIATDDEIAAHAIKQGVEPETLIRFAGIMNQVVIDDDC